MPEKDKKQKAEGEQPEFRIVTAEQYLHASLNELHEKVNRLLLIAEEESGE